MEVIAAKRCPRCQFPILATGDDFDRCISCGWEDYGPPKDGFSEPEEVPCPGFRRAMLLEEAPSKWGLCPACGERMRPSIRGTTPKHWVMSDRMCDGSHQKTDRVVFKENRNTIQTRGCRGCGLQADQPGTTLMNKHRIAEAPKVCQYFNDRRT